MQEDINQRTALQEIARELAAARQQFSATADILRLIASTQHGRSRDTQSVFNAIAAQALKLCSANWSAVELVRGDHLELLALHNVAEAKVDALKAAFPMPIASDTVAARVVRTGRTAHLVNMARESHALKEDALRVGYLAGVGVPMRNGKRVIGVIFVARDAPGRFAPAQVALLRSFADQAVIAITNARLFDDLEEKSRELAKLNAYKTRFLAAASHDIRQPLHALTLFIAQIRFVTSDAERARLTANVEAAVASVNELVGVLLDMAKLEAGLLVAHHAEFPLSDVLGRLSVIASELACQKGLKFWVTKSKAWVRSDPALLERILLNLLTNALRYTHRGSVAVSCRRRGTRLAIEVIDTGRGIPRRLQGRVFEEFFQIEDQGRLAGFGLGLAIVDRLCRLLEHPLELSSLRGKGSCFRVIVPIAKPRSKHDSVSPGANPFAGKLVALIDDDRTVLTAMRGILEGWSCKVVTGTSAKSLLLQVARLAKVPDIIVADFGLARGQTGTKAIARIRAELGHTIPAVLITADTALSAKELGGDALPILRKPVPPMVLRATLTRMLTLSRQI